jgi:hypothetical protein
MSSPIPSKATPLPMAQIAILMGVRLAEPIQYTGQFAGSSINVKSDTKSGGRYQSSSHSLMRWSKSFMLQDTLTGSGKLPPPHALSRRSDAEPPRTDTTQDLWNPFLLWFNCKSRFPPVGLLFADLSICRIISFTYVTFGSQRLVMAS